MRFLTCLFTAVSMLAQSNHPAIESVGKGHAAGMEQDG